MWSSAAVAHLLQGSTCCAFRDGILHALVVTSQMPKCIELLPCDWLISNLCYQAIEQVYLIKWLVSVCMYVCVYIQWVWKVFRPPYIFHSLLYCSHLLKSFKFIFFPH